MEKLVLPKELPERLSAWYQENARELPWRHDREPYHIWLSEIMLQQTRVEAVKGYYARFLAQCPTVQSLAEASPDVLNKLWEGLGYYSRVRNLQKAAIVLMEDFGGVFPKTYAQVRSLPGIGPYTAGAICSIAYDLPTPAVDGNVLRVVSRLLCLVEPVTREYVKRSVEQALLAIYPEKAGEFTQSLMELGATICTPNGTPRCAVCPIRELCLAAREDKWAQYPVKEPKKARRIEDRTVFVLRCDGREAVRRREKKGLLAGLWEYPNVPGALDALQAVEQASAWGCCPQAPEMQLDRVHVFTHVQWNLRCYYLDCREMPDIFVWATPLMLDREIALPTAFRMFRE